VSERPRSSETVTDKLDRQLNRATEVVADKIAEVKPKLRGWIHAVTVPVALVAFVVLIALCPTTETRVGAVVYAASALLLFTVSGVYHRGTWSPRVWALLRRMDHASIYVLIAGSYTPFAILFLHGTARLTLLLIVWVAAVAGVFFRVFWPDAPRWLSTPLYVALGWAAVFFIPDFVDGARPFGTGIAVTVLILVAAGGVLYTLGGVVYGLKRPDPWPRWFGFHEIFHAFTIAAFVCHYVAVSLATYALR
jgi:hemolysin III